jgi:hypothetical protein
MTVPRVPRPATRSPTSGSDRYRNFREFSRSGRDGHAGPDGGLYIGDDVRDQILELRNGDFRVSVGNGKAGFNGDGGLASKAEINQPQGMTFGPDGTLYFADYANRPRPESLTLGSDLDGRWRSADWQGVGCERHLSA